MKECWQMGWGSVQRSRQVFGPLALVVCDVNYELGAVECGVNIMVNKGPR